MSRLPAPRNIRRDWKPGGFDLARCAAEISTRFAPALEYGPPVEARSWVAARAWRKGMAKRVDVAYENEAGEVRFASVRLSNGFYTLRLGDRAVV